MPGDTNVAVVTQHPTLGRRWLIGDGNANSILYTENETNYERAFGVKNPRPFVKDAFGRFLINNDASAINPKRTGTKAAFHYVSIFEPGATETIRLRLTDMPEQLKIDPVAFDAIVDGRIAEADAFYANLLPATADPRGPHDPAPRVRRTALDEAVLQLHHPRLAQGRSADAGAARQRACTAAIPVGRTSTTTRCSRCPTSGSTRGMPRWDLAFHVIPFALIDPDFAKRQLVALTRERYMHPNGQLPAYEWAFDDVNPPVHAWAAYRIYKIEAKRRGGVGDMPFLERVFQKLLLNFTWWVNRKDVAGRNVFQGGFLGLDNIGVFDRSTKLPTGGYLAQADGTAWMAVYSLNMLAIAIELARHDPVYEHLANKFFEHFLYIADAMNSQRADDDQGVGLWDAQDEFYYDQLYLPTGERIPLKVRSAVGIIPIFAVETLDPDTLEKLPLLKARVEWFIANRPELAENVARIEVSGMRQRRLLAIVNPERLRRILRRLFESRRVPERRTGCARSRNSTMRTPTCSTSAARAFASTTSRPNRPAVCSAATPTGAVRSGFR